MHFASSAHPTGSPILAMVIGSIEIRVNKATNQVAVNQGTSIFTVIKAKFIVIIAKIWEITDQAII